MISPETEDRVRKAWAASIPEAYAYKPDAVFKAYENHAAIMHPPHSAYGNAREPRTEMNLGDDVVRGSKIERCLTPASKAKNVLDKWWEAPNNGHFWK